jgi:hypothetical protein
MINYLKDIEFLANYNLSIRFENRYRIVLLFMVVFEPTNEVDELLVGLKYLVDKYNFSMNPQYQIQLSGNKPIIEYAFQMKSEKLIYFAIDHLDRKLPESLVEFVAMEDLEGDGALSYENLDKLIKYSERQQYVFILALLKKWVYINIRVVNNIIKVVIDKDYTQIIYNLKGPVHYTYYIICSLLVSGFNPSLDEYKFLVANYSDLMTYLKTNTPSDYIKNELCKNCSAVLFYDKNDLCKTCRVAHSNKILADDFENFKKNCQTPQ